MSIWRSSIYNKKSEEQKETAIRNIAFDGRDYKVIVSRNRPAGPLVPRIVVVGYQPNKNASRLLELCIKTIKKFTLPDYELWIVDNNSPWKHTAWLKEINGINTALIRTEPKGGASYANGLALEIAVRLIGPDARFLMSLHEDTAVCRYGWLKYMVSKLSGDVKAAGFHLSKSRIPEGVLHVDGYIIDLQVFRKLGLSYMPRLPDFDVGDKAIYKLTENGYKTFCTPNTFNDSILCGSIPETLEMHHLNTTRSFNDSGEVIYMHLGRGIPKARGEYKNKEKSSSEQWIDYVKSSLLSEPQLQRIEEDLIDGFDFYRFSISDFYFINAFRSFYPFIKRQKGLSAAGNISSLKEYLGDISIMDLKDKDLFNKKIGLIAYHGTGCHQEDAGKIIAMAADRLEPGGVFMLTGKGCPQECGKVVSRTWELGFREVRFNKMGTDNICDLSLELLNIKNNNESGIKKRNRIKRIIDKRLKKIARKDNIKIEKQLFDYGKKTIGHIIIAVK